MNQENIWMMFYFIPSMYGYQGWEQNTLAVNSTKQDESQKLSRKYQDFIQQKPLPFEEIKKKYQKKVQFQEEIVQDSSFIVPNDNISKVTEQKLGRNSVSNILRLFAKMLRTPIFKQIFTKVKNKYDIPFGLKQFFSWTNCIGLFSNKYIRIKKILKGIRLKQQYGRMLSILFETFVSQYARQSILTSSKTESKNVFPTMNQIRKIKQEINQAVKNGNTSVKKNKKNVFN